MFKLMSSVIVQEVEFVSRTVEANMPSRTAASRANSPHHPESNASQEHRSGWDSLAAMVAATGGVVCGAIAAVIAAAVIIARRRQRRRWAESSESEQSGPPPPPAVYYSSCYNAPCDNNDVSPAQGVEPQAMANIRGSNADTIGCKVRGG
jgi:hypothetical protein